MTDISKKAVERAVNNVNNGLIRLEDLEVIRALRAEVDALEAKLAERVVVKPGQIERIVWSAMVWARENPGPDEVPEYTDGGNSFAETECRATVRRILSALTTAPITPAEAARVLLASFDKDDYRGHIDIRIALRDIAQEGQG